MTKGKVHPVDLHVGATIRIRRKMLKASQADVASAVGLTFQQLQKYENGTNRVSASKLFQIAQFLQLPVARFFEGMPGAGCEFEAVESEPKTLEFLKTAEGIELAKTFPRIASARRRRKVLDLVLSLAND